MFFAGLMNGGEIMMNFSNENTNSLPQLMAWFDDQQQKVAQELHDSILQQQILLLRKCEQFLQEETSMTPTYQLRVLHNWYEALQDLIFETRDLCQRIRNPFISPISLQASLMQLCKYMSLHSNIEVCYTNQLLESIIQDEQKLHVFRIIQELFFNAIKHSRASLINLSIAAQHNFLFINYEDNGVGMKIESYNFNASMGLSGIFYRVNALGGSYKIRSKQGEGFHFNMQAPISLQTSN